MPIIPVTGKQLPSCGDLVQQCGIEEWPMGCMHGAIIYDNKRNIDQSMHLDPHFVRDLSRLMRQHNKSTFLYVEDWNAMVTKEENGTKDWEQVARGFDPAVRDERETDFMQRVLKGKETIYKVRKRLNVWLLGMKRRSFRNRCARGVQWSFAICVPWLSKSGLP